MKLLLSLMMIIFTSSVLFANANQQEEIKNYSEFKSTNISAIESNPVLDLQVKTKIKREKVQSYQAAVYMRSVIGEVCWADNSLPASMDMAFGAGNWDLLLYETVDVNVLFTPATKVIYMEGGCQNADELEAFLNANRTALENWVAAGGSLLLNAAPNEGNGMDYGFNGVILQFSLANAAWTPSDHAKSANPAHPIYNYLSYPTGSEWYGNSFSHALLSYSPNNPLIVDYDNNLEIICTEKEWGNGCVIFGGMTSPNHHRLPNGSYGSPEVYNLRRNMLDYLFQKAMGADQGRIEPRQDDLVLWLNGEDVDADGVEDPTVPDLPVPDSFFDVWYDITIPAENASSPNDKRHPTRKNAGILNRKGIQFIPDFTDHGYSNSDIMTFPYNAEITTAVEDPYAPDAQSKTYVLVLKTGFDISDGQNRPPYYRDGRQCIFEVGGPSSGLNTYLAEGKICTGSWNKIEKKFTILDPEGEFYNAFPNSIYYVMYTFDGAGKEIITEVGAYDPLNPDATIVHMSNPMSFNGLHRDMTMPNADDRGAVGGASRTRYHDFNIGADFSDFFGGTIGEVLMYNAVASRAEVLPYIDEKYGTNFAAAPIAKNSSDWKVYDLTEEAGDEIATSQAYPNPFENTTSFDVNLPESQFVTVNLFDAAGNKVKEIMSGKLNAGNNEITIDAKGLENGTYYYQLVAGDYSETGKVVLVK